MSDPRSRGIAIVLSRAGAPSPASRRAVFVVGAWMAAALWTVAGCAAWRGGRQGEPADRSSTAAGGATKVWALLVAGDDRAAEAAAAAGVAAAPHDRLTRLADASLAFERGDSPRAIASYLALLEAASAGAALDLARADAAAESEMAALAAGRLGTLLEEHGGSEPARRTIEDRILRIAPPPLAWPARHALALLDERIATRRGDPAALGAAAARNGCLRTFEVQAATGRLPHLDLETPARAGARGAGRLVRRPGCVVAIPSYEGRAGAQRVTSEVDVAAAGAFDIVLDFHGEARVIADGVAVHAHGGERTYGPRVSATRVAWQPGRHRIELRLASYGGHPELALLVVPAAGAPPVGTPAVEVEGQGVASGAPLPVGAPLEAARLYARAYVANQLGDVAGAERAARSLAALPRLAIGATLAAALARDDPSQPSGFARESARVLLRAAVAVDSRLARARNALAGLALDDDRPHEALDEAQQAAAAAPAWWLPRLTLHGAYRLRGLEWDADRALDRAVALGGGACSVVETALLRAEARRDAGAVRRLEDATIVCGEVTDDRVERLRRRGDLDGAEALLRRGMALGPDPSAWRRSLARLVLARGRPAEAAALLEADLEPTDGEGVKDWVDALIAAGDAPRARARLAALLEDRPDLPQILRAARALGLPLPLDAYRLDGRAVIREFERSKRTYAASSPAVVLLDRAVTRVLPSGALITLTHEIVRVQSKDAIEKWGEVSVPEGAEVLTLRTHKPDGTTREPEEVAGKDAISAADLAIGDVLEKETLEVRGPQQAFEGDFGDPAARPAAQGAPAASRQRSGFLSDRFFFQSFDAPLDRTEFLLVTEAEVAQKMSVDARAGAPAPIRAPAGPGLVLTTFAARQVPQLFGERSPVPAIDYVPSMRASFAARWPAWTRFLREQLHGTARDAGGLDQAERQIRALAGTAPSLEALASALVAWVGENVEASEDLRGPATYAVASGRGNRVAVLLALARRLGLPAEVALGRSRFTAEGSVAAPVEEADDFAEVLVRFTLPGGRVLHVDPRLKHAPIGYVSPGLDGARAVVLSSGAFETVRSAGENARTIELSARVAADGRAQVKALEVIRGWPALEWSEIVDQLGGDETKMRQDFEQRWLGVHFPGAELKDLQVDIPSKPSGDSPRRPYAAAEVRVRYAFTSPRFGTADASGLRITPLFFRAQPGRRYATESRRTVPLLTSFDVPTTLRARIELPSGARLAGTAGSDAERVVAREGEYRFRERRHLDSGAEGGVSQSASRSRSASLAGGHAPVLTLEREARLSILRVPPDRYPTVAEDLRRVDAYEREDISVVVGRSEGASR